MTSTWYYFSTTYTQATLLSASSCCFTLLYKPNPFLFLFCYALLHFIYTLFYSNSTSICTSLTARLLFCCELSYSLCYCDCVCLLWPAVAQYTYFTCWTLIYCIIQLLNFHYTLLLPYYIPTIPTQVNYSLLFYSTLMYSFTTLTMWSLTEGGVQWR